MAYEKEVPRWEGETAEPPESKKNEGYLAGDKPPAKWENWLRKGTYEAIKELQEKAQGKTDKGQPNGYPELDEDGNIPTGQLGNATSLIGTITNLLTTVKTNLVSAINEIFNDLKAHKAESTQLTITTLASGFTGSINYEKSNHKIITLKVDVTKSTDFIAATNNLIATLPVGYRPSNTERIYMHYTNATGTLKDATGFLAITATGDVVFVTALTGTFTGAIIARASATYTARG